MESWISISQGIYKHFRDIVGLITDEQNKANISVKWVIQFFSCFPIHTKLCLLWALNYYVFHSILPKNIVYLNLKIFFLLKMLSSEAIVSCKLFVEGESCLHVDGCWLIRLLKFGANVAIVFLSKKTMLFAPSIDCSFYDWFPCVIQCCLMTFYL